MGAPVQVSGVAGWGRSEGELPGHWIDPAVPGSFWSQSPPCQARRWGEDTGVHPAASQGPTPGRGRGRRARGWRNESGPPSRPTPPALAPRSGRPERLKAPAAPATPSAPVLDRPSAPTRHLGRRRGFGAYRSPRPGRGGGLRPAASAARLGFGHAPSVAGWEPYRRRVGQCSQGRGVRLRVRWAPAPLRLSSPESKHPRRRRAPILAGPPGTSPAGALQTRGVSGRRDGRGTGVTPVGPNRPCVVRAAAAPQGWGGTLRHRGREGRALPQSLGGRGLTSPRTLPGPHSGGLLGLIPTSAGSGGSPGRAVRAGARGEGPRRRRERALSEGAKDAPACRTCVACARGRTERVGLRTRVGFRRD